MRRLNTLRTRFALWVAVLLLVVLAAFGAFVYASLDRGLAASVDASLQLSAAQAIAAVNLENGQINFTDTLPQGSVTDNLRDSGVTMRVLSPSGQILQAVGRYRSLPVRAESLSAAQRGQTIYATISVAGETDAVRLYAAPIVANGQWVGIMEVAQSLAPVQAALGSLVAALLVAGPLLVAVAAASGYFLAARALAPIDQITQTARRIAEGGQNLSARIHLPATEDEVGRLATTIDTMLAKLDLAFRREQQFTTDASHELRTPLTAMQAILSVTRAERRRPEVYEQALADLADEANRLRSLVEDLLVLARSDSGVALDREPIDLSTLLADINDSLQPLAASKGLMLDCQIHEQLCLEGDRDSLVRLFVNLVDNALKYTERGGVTIGAGLNGQAASVCVSDTGQGIAPQHLPYIFNRFYRADPSRTSPGTGLGLAIALSIARAHGGTIAVSSTMGVGTTFTVRLPVLPGA